MLWKCCGTRPGGRGGTGPLGARPGQAEHKLVDPDFRGGGNSSGSAIFDSRTYNPAIFPTDIRGTGKATNKRLRRCLIDNSFGFSASL